MLRPLLSASGVSFVEYHKTCFDRDLRKVTSGKEGTHFRLSICSFCPDWPDVPMYAEPAVAFHALEDSLWFLCSFFASQLVDQACHASMGRVLKRRADSQGQIVLVGLLSTYWQVMTPAFLLLVLNLYRFPVSVGKVEQALETGLRSELEDLDVSPEQLREVLATAAAALQEAAIPKSLRAFVPDGDAYKLQPDFRNVERLRQGALKAVGGAAT